jgi:hypothetical protein
MRFAALLASVLSLMLLRPSYGDELNFEKKAAIKELLEVTGAMQMGEVFANAFSQQMTQVLKKSKPDINNEEVNALIHEELVVKESFYPYMYPVYHKYLTLDETRGLIRFYRTPLGKKAISVMPKMTQEGMNAGQAWGQSIAPKLQQRVSERFKREGIQ